MADLLNKVAPFGIWVVPALAVAISMINGSFFHQIFNLVDSTLTSPIPENADENFWVLQSAFLGAICLATYAFLHSDKVEGYVLKEMFVNDAQRGLARALLLAPIKGVLFLFVSQQVVMFVSSLTLPPGANSNSPWMIEEPSLLESARRFMDGKLIIMLYATMGLAILGVKTGLLSVRPSGKSFDEDMGIDVAEVEVGIVKAVLASTSKFVFTSDRLQLLQYAAVGIVRVYPVLNHAGVDMGSALTWVWTRAPLATFALGFLAVWPVTTLGDALKRAWGTDLSSVVCICTINLIASLWSNQAGRWLGMLLLQDMMDARIDPEGPLFSISTVFSFVDRLAVIALFLVVALVFYRAVRIAISVYPILMCEFGSPEYLDVKLEGTAEHLSNMWKGYHKFFVSQYGDGTTGRRRRGVMSTLAALLKEAVQMYRAMKSVWVDQKTLRVVATFKLPVRNIQSVQASFKGMNIVVLARKKLKNPTAQEAMYPQPVLQVASVAIKGFTVDANTDEFQDKTVSVLLDLQLKSIIKLSQASDGLDFLDVVLSVVSSGDTAVSIPLLTYSDKKWTTVGGPKSPGGASDALTVRMKHNQDQLGAIAKHIKESQDKFLATIREGDELQAREVPVRLAANVHHLLVVIGGIERSMSKFDTTKHKYITDVVGLDQLLKAAHLLVCIRIDELEQLKGSAQHELSNLYFVQLGSILANMFYQTCATNMISKGDRANPLHLIIMSVGMIALQAYMNPRTLTDIALIQVPEAPVEQQPGEGDRVEPSNGSNPEPSAPTLGVLLEVDGSIPTAILLNPADLDDNDVDPDVDEDPVVDDGPIDVDKGDLSDDDDVPVKFMGFGFKGGPLSTTELLNKMTGRAVGRPATTATRAPPPPPQPVTATTARAFTPAAPAPVQPATSAPTANRAPNNNSKPLAQLPRSSDGATVGPEDEVRAGTGEGGEPSEASGVVVDNQGDASGGEDDSDTGEEGLSDIDSEDEEPVQMMEVVVGGNRRGPRR